MNRTTLPVTARDRLALALDVDDIVVAERLARSVAEHFRTVKVGLELFSAAGPDAVGTFVDLGFDVFLDVKLHDIPTTVGKAATVLGALGATYLTVHAMGGVPMLTAAVDGLASGAERAGLEPPTALAITVLTSDDGAPPHIVPRRVAMAMEAGCGGVVCAVGDAAEVRSYGPRLTIVTPGIRPAGAAAHDQARAATPAAAVAAGADLLVIGRAVTHADDPAAAAAAIVAELS